MYMVDIKAYSPPPHPCDLCIHAVYILPVLYIHVTYATRVLGKNKKMRHVLYTGVYMTPTRSLCTRMHGDMPACCD